MRCFLEEEEEGVRKSREMMTGWCASEEEEEKNIKSPREMDGRGGGGSTVP